jgi:anti-sigma regulatory factor (Ser/Thr protein kinase)
MQDHETGELLLEKRFSIEGGDFIHAGGVSSAIKKILKDIGIRSEIIRRASIASYEAEMNVVAYARKGEVTFRVTHQYLQLLFKDEGQGIEDIELAMQEGYSTATEAIREMGFGAGMGLPNIKKNVDGLTIESEVGVGTRVEMIINT